MNHHNRSTCPECRRRRAQTREEIIKALCVAGAILCLAMAAAAVQW